MSEPTPIVIPLHKQGGKFGNDTEARYTIRSIEKHFVGEFRLCVVSSKLPEWSSNIELIPDGGKGLKCAVRRAAEAFPGGFFWWYDDCCLLQDQTPKLLKVTAACKGWRTDNQGRWSRDLDKVRARLVEENIHPVDYSRPHGPYWFDKGMIDEAFDDWPGMAGKFPFESWILSKRGWPHRINTVSQYYGAFRPPVDTPLLNYNDSGNTVELREWLGERFPEKSSYEVANLRNKVFFIHVPKTAGSAVMTSLGAQCVTADPSRHLPWSDPKVREMWSHYGGPPIAACVREPVKRAVSVYNYFRGREFPPRDQPHCVLHEMLQHMTLAQFWEKVDLDRLSSVIKHLRPQADFLRGAPVGHLLRVETLEEDYAKLADFLGGAAPLQKVNASTKFDEKLTVSATERIRNFYHEDYELYYP